MIENPPVQERQLKTASVEHRSLRGCKRINLYALLRTDIAFVAVYCQIYLYFGVYSCISFQRFRFAFTEPLQRLKMFCSFTGSLSLEVLCCEAAQLRRDSVSSASGLPTSYSGRGTEKGCYSPDCASRTPQSSCVGLVSQNYVQFTANNFHLCCSLPLSLAGQDCFQDS